MASTNLLPNAWREWPLDAVATLAPVQLLNWSVARQWELEVAIKREDLLHAQMGGNKFYKLAGHLEAFRRQGSQKLLSFGGAYSNHLYALAAAGQALGISTVGIVRGERPSLLSATLQDAAAMGMELMFVSRREYERKTHPQRLMGMRQDFADCYVIPEGGGDARGSTGCRQWAITAVALAPWRPDVICLAAGTGGTSAGVLASGVGISVCAFLALKGESAEIADMKTRILEQACVVAGITKAELPSFSLESNYHCGGYARFPADLRRFVSDFEAETGVPLDPVYTAKMFWGIACKASEGHWRPGTRILVLHSGGLQGRRGFPGL